MTAPCQGDVNLPYGHQPTFLFATQQIGEHTTVRTGYFSLIHSQCCLHTGAIGTRSMVCPGTCNTGLVNTTEHPGARCIIASKHAPIPILTLSQYCPTHHMALPQELLAVTAPWQQAVHNLPYGHHPAVPFPMQQIGVHLTVSCVCLSV